MRGDNDDNDKANPTRPFGVLLKSYRRAVRLSQEELAQRAGLSVRTISGLENGARHVPYKETARLLAQALALTPEDSSAFLAAARLAGSDSHVLSASNAPGETTLFHYNPGIPAPVTPLLGRKRDVENVSELLLRSDVRLLTLHGPPGVGKTRLSVEVAKVDAHAFPGGVFAVALAALSDPALVERAIATSVGVRESGSGNLGAELIETLHTQYALLLLDNFEHLLDAAPLVGLLLRDCPNLKILATSRERLGLGGEQLYRVAPLSLPKSDGLPPHDLLRASSVRLFLDRAQRMIPTFALTPDNAPAIAAICRRLDGLPLALELAAARIALLTPDELLRRLESRLAVLTAGARDMPARQRTLRNTLIWSHDLLNESERALFRRFSVFAGGATLPAVHAICLSRSPDDAACDELVTLDLLTSLVDKNLLTASMETQFERGEARYHTLETIREYAGELLSASGEAEQVRRAHTAYCVAVAEAAETLTWPERGNRYNAFEDDLDNVRAALRWAMNSQTSEDVELGLRLAGALGMFWYNNGHLEEGSIWLRGLLARSTEGERVCGVSVRAKALHMAGWIAIDQGEYVRATTLLAQSVAWYRATDEHIALSAVLNRCGEAALRQGDCAAAAEYFTEGLELRKRERDIPGIAASLANLGAVAAEQGEYERAVLLLEEARGIYASLGERTGVLFILNSLAEVAWERADYPRAISLCQECIRLARNTNDATAQAHSMGILACVAHDQRDYSSAAEHWRASLTLHRQQGNRYSIAYCLCELANVERDRGRLREAMALYWESLELYRKMAVTRGAVACLEGLASISVSLEHADRVAELCGAVAALREMMGTPSRPVHVNSYERAESGIRAVLGEERFAAAWAVGRHVPAESVFASALKIAADIYHAP